LRQTTARRPAERVHAGLDRDPIGVLDRGVIGDEQTRSVVEEDAPVGGPRQVLAHAEDPGVGDRLNLPATLDRQADGIGARASSHGSVGSLACC
jgi:hypothetical protein